MAEEKLENSVRMLKKVISEIEYEAKRSASTADGDYIKDGLLHCHVCNEPKEARINIFSEMIVPCLCKCGLEERKAVEQKQKDEELRMKIEQMKFECFESKHLWTYTFENCTIKNDLMYKTAVKFVENFDKLKEDGLGLLYFGSVGYGKTYIAASIANALIDKGHSCYMGSMANIASIMSDTGTKRSFLKGLTEYELFIIDDLGAERDSSYMNEIVYLIIDRRYHAHLPTIITTNMTGEELRKPTDEAKKRVMSRLYEMCLFIEVKGKDRRRMESVENYEKYRDVLGLPGKE